MRFLSLGEVLELHRRIVADTGGASELRELGALESAVSQPRMTFRGQDLYPDLGTKAAALAFSLVSNHPFVDGNKRVGHAAMETFLILNGSELVAPVVDAERVMLELAAGQLDREAFASWVKGHIRPMRE